jgi:hypothetical protein
MAAVMIMTQNIGVLSLRGSKSGGGTAPSFPKLGKPTYTADRAHVAKRPSYIATALYLTQTIAPKLYDLGNQFIRARRMLRGGARVTITAESARGENILFLGDFGFHKPILSF